MKLLCFILLFSLRSQAEIIGGDLTEPVSDFPSKAIARIGVLMNPDLPSCTLTRVKTNILLMSAHCVERFLKGEKGFQLNERVRSYHVVQTKNMQAPGEKNPAHDLALVLFEPYHAPGAACPVPVPLTQKITVQIATQSTRLVNSHEIYFGGYGAKKISVNSEKGTVDTVDSSKNLTFGKADCERSKESGSVLSSLKAKSAPLTIDNKSGGPIAGPGDSGSGAFQKDLNGNWNVIGVFSELDITHANDRNHPYLKNLITPVQAPDNEQFIKNSLNELETERLTLKVCPE